MTTRTDPTPTPTPTPAWRTGVWLLLVASAVGNTVASLAAVPLVVQLVLGVCTGACAVLLVASYARHRR